MQGDVEGDDADARRLVVGGGQEELRDDGPEQQHAVHVVQRDVDEAREREEAQRRGGGARHEALARGRLGEGEG